MADAADKLRLSNLLSELDKAGVPRPQQERVFRGMTGSSSRLAKSIREGLRLLARAARHHAGNAAQQDMG